MSDSKQFNNTTSALCVSDEFNGRGSFGSWVQFCYYSIFKGTWTYSESDLLTYLCDWTDWWPGFLFLLKAELHSHFCFCLQQLNMTSCFSEKSEESRNSMKKCVRFVFQSQAIWNEERAQHSYTYMLYMYSHYGQG